MPTLEIYLTDGFTADPVVVRVDGREVYTGEVTTQLLLGFAENLTVPIAADVVKVEIELPQRNQSAACNVEPEKVGYITAAVEEGALRLRVSEQPPGFV